MLGGCLASVGADGAVMPLDRCSSQLCFFHAESASREKDSAIAAAPGVAALRQGIRVGAEANYAWLASPEKISEQNTPPKTKGRSLQP